MVRRGLLQGAAIAGADFFTTEVCGDWEGLKVESRILYPACKDLGVGEFGYWSCLRPTVPMRLEPSL